MKRKLITILKSLFIIAFVLFFGYNLLSTSFSKVNVSEATPEFYVNDFANMISDKEKGWMIERAEALYDEYGCKIVVTTVDSTANHAMDNYAETMYKQYGLGDLDLLILYCREGNQFCLKVGKGLKSYITNSNGMRFIQENFSYIETRTDLDLSFRNMQIAFIDEISSRLDFANRYPNLVKDKASHSSENVGTGKVSFTDFFIFFLYLLVVFLLVYSNRLNKKIYENKKKKWQALANAKHLRNN